MMRTLLAGFLALLFLAFQSAAFAQTPTITTEFSEEAVTVGQPFVLRVTVLVPTHMPKPPIFPSFETENMIVRLPERSTTPTSKVISGTTWSGITRSYRMYPMVAGQTQIPAQSVTLFYMSPETNQEITFTGRIPELTINATLPKGAEGLNPPLLAQGLSATQTLIPQEGPIAEGDSIERKIIVKIDGTSPLFIPPFLGSEDIDGVAIYPQDPKVTETSNRGVMSGTREERVVYIAQTAGTAVLPDLSLEWFNLKTNSIETVDLPGLSVAITQPNIVERSLDKNLIGTLIVAPLLALLLWLLWARFARARFQRIRHRLRANYNNSPHAAFRSARKAAQAYDLTRLLSLVDNLEQSDALEAALHNLTHARYGTTAAPESEIDRHWTEIAHHLKKAQPRVSIGAALGLKRQPHRAFGHDLGNQGS
ncbi:MULTISPECIES: hypothetical protein [Falsihalocynthiibacter]|uniref:hypothetical protein n=1 Tax=Falsihalocynthiibacter TaxID=2854182 RepID=UPI0030027DCE